MRALVTGGGGYVGRAIVRQLLDRGDEVTVLGRRSYPEVEAWGAAGVQCDLGADDPALAEHLAGHDVVFHVAALPPYHAARELFVATNVDGTRRVIEACRAAGVPKLVFTGTPSATFDPAGAEGITEDEARYPETYETAYAETKAEAERMVLAAHSPELATTVLRPRLVYGPDEPHMIPRIIARNRAGRLRIIGDGHNKAGLTYVDNAAAAHLQAADALGPDSPNGGRAYFVTDPEPVELWPWLNTLLEGIDEPRITKTISLGAARTVGAILEFVWSLFGLAGEPPMTRFVATNLATPQWYDLSNGRRDFGLEPVVTAEDGLARTIDWFAEHKDEAAAAAT